MSKPDLDAIEARAHTARNPDSIDGVMARWGYADDVTALLAYIGELEQWKIEALEVMTGLQELGQALGLPLGVKVTGTQAVELAKELTTQIERLEFDLEAAAYRAGVAQGRIGQLQTQIERVRDVGTLARAMHPIAWAAYDRLEGDESRDSAIEWSLLEARETLERLALGGES